MKAVSVHDRAKVGLTCHEGLEVGPDGSLYFINEQNGGSVFRLAPTGEATSRLVSSTP